MQNTAFLRRNHTDSQSKGKSFIYGHWKNAADAKTLYVNLIQEIEKSDVYVMNYLFRLALKCSEVAQ